MNGSMKKIADISHYQGSINWTEARKELSLVIFRASVGMKQDQKYLENASACGIPYGVYHYVKAGTAEEAEQEARFFVESANRAAGKPLFYIADIEYKAQTAATTEAVCVAFLETLQKLGCAKIGLYINTRYPWAGTAIGMCDIMWIPHWGKNDGEVPAAQYMPKHACDLWQYTSKGRVAGVSGNVDLNKIIGSKSLEWFTGQKEENMSDTNRVQVPFTNEHFVAFLRQMVGAPYWYGTCMYKCTESLRARKAKQYPSHYGSSRTARYKRDIAGKKVCADCIGAAKGYAWTNGGQGVIEAIGTDKSITSKYGSNGCPDKGANGMFAWAKTKGAAWGTIETLPEIPGLAVTHSGHVGYYVGGGKVIEFKGFNYGCVESDLKKGKWTHWYELPFIHYGEATQPDTPNTPETPTKITLGARLLKRGSKGGDVTELQRILVGLGYDLGTYGPDGNGVDGDYGAATEKAVRKFQSTQQIMIDGVYGNTTHAALMGVLADKDATEPDDGGDTPTEEISGKRVEVTGENVNVRTGAATTYKIITRVNAGDAFPFVATAEAYDWHAVEVGGKIGWISGKYSVVKG